METKKTILTGTAIATAILGAASMQANTNLFDYTSLGSGAEVRSVLLNNAPSAVKFMDLNCGEKKDAEKKEAKGTKEGEHNKSKDAKCGAEKKAGEHKSKDAKCGEGKCGDKKAKTTTEPK